MADELDTKKLRGLEMDIRSNVVGRGADGYIRITPGVAWTILDVLRELLRLRAALESIVELPAGGDVVFTDRKFDEGYDLAMKRCRAIALDALGIGRGKDGTQ
jgi:hypothetical protein